MAAGAAGGLFALLLAALVTPWLHQADAESGELADTRALRAIQALLSLFAAAVLGALYWLSWGLAAVVNVPWWLRGVAFAAVCWLALAVPVLLALRTRIAIRRRTLSAAGLEWLLVCVGAGLACAWTAARSP